MESDQNIRNRDKVVWAEALKVVSILGVIMMHISDSFMTSAIQSDSNESFLLGTFFTCLSSFCIPVFFMLTGAFLLDKTNESYSGFFYKRLIKIVIPLIFWVIAYGLFEMYYLKKDIKIFEWFWDNFNNGAGCFHLWFMFDLITLYTLIPVLRIFINSAKNMDLRYFLLIWYVLVFIIPVLKLHFNLGLGLKSIYWTPQIGYIVLGYYLKNKANVGNFGLWLLLFFVSVVIQTSIYFYSGNSLNNLRLYEIDIDALQPFKSTFIFLFFMALYLKLPNLTSYFDTMFLGLGNKTYGIYFIHIMVLSFVGTNVYRIKVPLETYGIEGYILGNTVLVYCISFTIIFFLKKIPIPASIRLRGGH